METGGKWRKLLHSDTLLLSTFPGMQEDADRKGAEEQVERVGICCLSRRSGSRAMKALFSRHPTSSADHSPYHNGRSLNVFLDIVHLEKSRWPGLEA